jgi:hypothetical protein
MNRISEAHKIDIGVVSGALNNTNTTGRFYDMSKDGRALFVLTMGAMAASTTATLTVYEAQDASATGFQTLAAATATANTNVTVATVDLSSAAATDVVTINGLAYTFAAASTAASRTFSTTATLAAAVNHATAGVPGVTATAATSVVTLTATDPGETVITAAATNGSGTITVATTQAILYVEVDAGSMDLADGYTHLGANVATTANSTVNCTLIRGQARVSPTQKVADYGVA